MELTTDFFQVFELNIISSEPLLPPNFLSTLEEVSNFTVGVILGDIHKNVSVIGVIFPSCAPPCGWIEVLLLFLSHMANFSAAELLHVCPQSQAAA